MHDHFYIPHKNYGEDRRKVPRDGTSANFI
jgi:hypothetical protein